MAGSIQVGTAFELCEESALASNLEWEVIRAALADEVEVFTDPSAFPSGYPFKVVGVAGTMSGAAVYDERWRMCDLGFLRPLQGDDGTVGYRCPGDPVEAYLAKGGTLEETLGRRSRAHTFQRRAVRGGKEGPLALVGSPAKADPAGVPVYDFVQLEVPFEDLKQQLFHGKAQWLVSLAVASYREGEATVVFVGLNGKLAVFEKNVEGERDEPLDREDVVAPRWRATGPSGPFPALDAHLEISRMGSTLTHVSLLGNYEPPGGNFERLIDRMGLHHVAEAGVRSFLRRVADTLVGAENSAALGRSGHRG